MGLAPVPREQNQGLIRDYILPLRVGRPDRTSELQSFRCPWQLSSFLNPPGLRAVALVVSHFVQEMFRPHLGFSQGPLMSQIIDYEMRFISVTYGYQGSTFSLYSNRENCPAHFKAATRSWRPDSSLFASDLWFTKGNVRSGCFGALWCESSFFELFAPASSEVSELLMPVCMDHLHTARWSNLHG